jgi:hypothetical protein
MDCELAIDALDWLDHEDKIAVPAMITKRTPMPAMPSRQMVWISKIKKRIGENKV